MRRFAGVFLIGTACSTPRDTTQYWSEQVANERIEAAGLNLEERVIDIWRCATVVKGGKRFSFAVMSVVGNGAGVMGVGYGKAREVPNAIEKAVKDAKKHLIRIPTFGSTIPHEVRGNYGASTVIMMPALPGTGVIAGSAVRSVLECIGVHDVLSKSVGGSNNKKNLVKAALECLTQLRNRETIAALRGVEIAPDALLAASLTAAKPKPKFEREERGGGRGGPGRGGPGRGGPGGGRGGPGGGRGGGGGDRGGGGGGGGDRGGPPPSGAAAVLRRKRRSSEGRRTDCQSKVRVGVDWALRARWGGPPDTSELFDTGFEARPNY